MEHYRKVSSKYVEDAVLPNEIRVVSSTKQNDFMMKTADMLNTDGKVTVSGRGEDSTKVVLLVEQFKRKIDQTVSQSSLIKYYKIEDYWKADTEGLDDLKVTRHIPVLSIDLAVSAPVSFKIKESQKKNRGRHDSRSQTQSHSSSKTQSNSSRKSKTRTTNQ